MLGQIDAEGLQSDDIDVSNVSALDWKDLVEKCYEAPIKSLIEIDSNGNTLLHSLVNNIENTSKDLEMLLKKYSTNDLKMLLIAKDKSKQTVASGGSEWCSAVGRF